MEDTDPEKTQVLRNIKSGPALGGRTIIWLKLALLGCQRKPEKQHENEGKQCKKMSTGERGPEMGRWRKLKITSSSFSVLLKLDLQLSSKLHNKNKAEFSCHSSSWAPLSMRTKGTTQSSQGKYHRKCLACFVHQPTLQGPCLSVVSAGCGVPSGKGPRVFLFPFTSPLSKG